MKDGFGYGKNNILKIAVFVLSAALLMQNVLAIDITKADELSEADMVSAAITHYEEAADTRTMEQKFNEEVSMIQY